MYIRPPSISNKEVEDNDLSRHIVKKELNEAIVDALVPSENRFSMQEADTIRKRKLPLPTVIKLLLSMTGGSLNRELQKSGIEVSSSAFSQRRAKIHSTAFENMFYNFNQAHRDTGKLKGFKVYAVDGSVINCPKAEHSPTYTWDGNSGYSAFHVTTLYDVIAHTYYTATIAPQSKQDEIRDFLFQLSWYGFTEPSICLGDRLFCTYNTLATIQAAGADYVIRAKDASSPSALKPIKAYAKEHPNQEFDVDLSFVITTSQTNEDKAAGRIFIQTGSKKGKINSPKTKISRWNFPSPACMSFRAIRYRLQDKGAFYTLVTSLPREKFSTEEVIALYARRWSLELSYRCTKYTMGLVHLHSKKDDYIKQEIWSAMTMQNFCSRIVSEVVINQKDTKYEYAVNFKMAVTLCKEFFADSKGDGEKLMRDIARYIEPIRVGRHDGRNLKTKSFPGFCYRIAA